MKEKLYSVQEIELILRETARLNREATQKMIINKILIAVARIVWTVVIVLVAVIIIYLWRNGISISF